jgi:hypothetical protein
MSIGLQHQVGRAVGITVDAVRALGHRQPILMDQNYPDPVTRLRPDPTQGQILVVETSVESWYSALLVGARTRLMRGQTYSVAYTWSSAENISDGARASAQNQRDLSADRGPVLNDARHRLVASGTASLPFGITLGMIVTARSALPYNITLPGDPNGDGFLNIDRPEGVGRNSGRGSALVQADLRLSKAIRIGNRQLELLLEAVNIANRVNGTDYDGRRTAFNEATPTFGTARDADVPRRIQVGARFTF